MSLPYKHILLFYFVIATLLGCKGNKAEITLEDKESRPNIIMIVTDDLGWFDISLNGNHFIETPNLERLASNGIQYTNAYAASALCSPSRASLITGLHPVQLNITEHIHGNYPAGSNQKLITPSINQQLDLQFRTIAEALKGNNYITGFIGKWHLGGGKFEPQHQGFDINIAGGYNGLPNSFFYPFFPNGEKPEIQNSSKEGDYLTDVLTNKALDFLTSQKDTLFFLSLNYYSPHVPIEGKDDLVKKYEEKRKLFPNEKFPDPHYAAMIESIDLNIGRILDKLQELNIRDNTLILFTSDNGGLSVEEVPAFAKHTPPTDNGPLRAGKGYLYEGGIREPLIISWPAKVKQPGVVNTPVIAQDFFNTITQVTNTKIEVENSISLLPTFSQKELPSRGLLWHLPHYSPQRGKPSSAYREGDWKIIHFYENNTTELYNLKVDISEEENLALKNPKRLEEMKKKMFEELNKLNAKFPMPNPNYKQ